jgi:hypothetical protein
MNAPNSQSRGRSPNDSAHPLGFGIQRAMAKEPANKLRYLLLLDIEVNQTIPFMTQASIIEIGVERKKCWSGQLVQKRDDFVVFHALPA